MTKKVLLGSVLGGLALFVWGFISHMLLPLGEVGIKVMPNEEPVMAAMSESLSEPGFYFFPGAGGHEMTQEWTEKYRQGPDWSPHLPPHRPRAAIPRPTAL